MTDDEVCIGCHEADEPHECGYVNHDCPDACNVEHEVDQEDILTCPVTGNHYRYCARCGWESCRYEWTMPPTYVNGELFCDPYEHGYERCYECDTWVDQDYIVYSEHRDAYYCSGCAPAEVGEEPGEGVRICRTCGTENYHLLVLSEDFACDCIALTAHLRGFPVEWHCGEAAPYRFLDALAAFATGPTTTLQEAA